MKVFKLPDLTAAAKNYIEGLREFYTKVHPGEPFSVESAENFLNSMFRET